LYCAYISISYAVPPWIGNLGIKAEYNEDILSVHPDNGRLYQTRRFWGWSSKTAGAAVQPPLVILHQRVSPSLAFGTFQFPAPDRDLQLLGFLGLCLRYGDGQHSMLIDGMSLIRIYGIRQP
jgi:hypothetical protein